MGYVEAQSIQSPNSHNSPSTDSIQSQKTSIDSLSLQSEYDVIEMALLEWSSAGCDHLEGVIVANEKHHHRDSTSSTSSSPPSESDMSPSPSLTHDDVEMSSDEFLFEYTNEPESKGQIYHPNYFPMRKHTQNWMDPYAKCAVSSFLGALTMTTDERDLLMDLLPEGAFGGTMS